MGRRLPPLNATKAVDERSGGGSWRSGRASTFLSVLTYCLQARWLAELIAGRHAVPSREPVLAEIAQLKVWKRGWMPFSASCGARLLLHMLHYHDELLQDFGANPLRKRGILAPLKELFVPYQPSDYRSIVAGDWEASEGRALMIGMSEQT